MAFCKLDQLKAQIAADNDKLSKDDLGIQDLALSAAIQSGERDIRDALEGIGFTASEIEAGDRLFEYHLNQSLFHLYSRRAAAHGGDPAVYAFYDCRKILSNPRTGWRVNGAVIWPGHSAPEDAGASIGYGDTGTGGADSASQTFRDEMRNTWARW